MSHRSHCATAAADTDLAPENHMASTAQDMGIYQHYIGRGLTAKQLEQERKRYLKTIGDIRKTEVLTYAARLSSLPMALPIGVAYEDLLPFSDLLADLKGKRITVILETPGGIGEVGRPMVDCCTHGSTTLRSSSLVGPRAPAQ
jgi:hypothetical protein